MVCSRSRFAFAACPVALFSLGLASPAQAQSAPATLDIAPLHQVDPLTHAMLTGESRVLQDNLRRDGLWFTTHNARAEFSPKELTGGTLWMKHAALGYGFGGSSGLSAFVAYGQGESRLNDGQHSGRIRGYGFGLGFDRQINQVDLSAAIFAGTMHSTISSPVSLSGSADFDGTQAGATLRVAGPLAKGRFDYALQGDLSWHEIEDYQLSGTGKGHVGKRTTRSTALTLEVGMPMTLAGLNLRPYAGVTAKTGSQGEFTYTDASGTSRFAATEVFDQTDLHLGATFDSKTRLGVNGRVELTRDTAGNTALSGRLGLAF